MSRRLVILILCSALAACGFKLRGNFEMSDRLSEVAINGGNRDLVTRLAETLQQSGSSVVPAVEGITTIVITRSDYEREVRTRNADGLATGYTYNYIVDFAVVSETGDTLLAPTSLKQSRVQDYDPENQLEAEEEEEFLRENMEEELVLQMLRRLARI